MRVIFFQPKICLEFKKSTHKFIKNSVLRALPMGVKGNFCTAFHTVVNHLKHMFGTNNWC